jgi:hypothetical protein
MSRIIFFTRTLKDLADRSLQISMGRSSDPKCPYFVELGGLELDLAASVASTLAEAGKSAALQLDRALECDESPSVSTLFRHEDIEMAIFVDNEIFGLELRCEDQVFRFIREDLQQFFCGLARLGGEIRSLRRATSRQQRPTPRELHPWGPPWL